MRDMSSAQAHSTAVALGALREQIHNQTAQSSTEELDQVIQDWNQLSSPKQMLQTALGTEKSIHAQEALREIASRSEQS